MAGRRVMLPTGAGKGAGAAVARPAAARGHDRVLTRGSSGGIVCIGSPFELDHHAASKCAVDPLVRGLGQDWRGGIRVNAVAPGLIDAAIHAGAGIPERVARIVPTVPMPRLGTPEHVAEAVLDVPGGR